MQLRRKRRKYKGYVNRYLSPAIYVRTADLLDTLPQFSTLRLPFGECPSRRWFYLRARLNRFVVVVHYVEDTVIILRLK